MRQALLAIVTAQLACAYPEFAFPEDGAPTDSGTAPETAPDVAPDAATDAASEAADARTTCEGITADLCDDFERGSVSSKWEGVEATGGVLKVVEPGYQSRYALLAEKSAATGSAHIMTKAVAAAAVGFHYTYAARVVRAPTDPTLGCFTSVGVVKARAPFGIALFPQPGGASNADLFGFMGPRERLGVVPTGVWVTFEVELKCELKCTVRARLNSGAWKQLDLIDDAAVVENAVQFGVNVGSAGGDWVIEIDDAILRWTR